jgi:hypothetical protein
MKKFLGRNAKTRPKNPDQAKWLSYQNNSGVMECWSIGYGGSSDSLVLFQDPTTPSV